MARAQAVARDARDADNCFPVPADVFGFTTQEAPVLATHAPAKFLGMLLSVLVAVLIAVASAGCDKSDSSAPAAQGASGGAAGAGGDATAAATDADGKPVSGLGKEAADAAIAEVNKHWAKGPDGYTTALTEGSNFAPIKFLRQVKELAVDRVEPDELGDSDKLNGVEWSGDVWLKQTPGREAGEQGIAFGGNSGILQRRPGAWTQWVDYQGNSLRVEKRSGAWRVSPDNTLVSGAVPTPADFAAAGVK